MIGVTGGVHLVQGGKQLLPALADVDLGQLVDAAGPVGYRVGRLGDVGRSPGQGEVVTHGFVVDEGGGVVDAVLVAQGVKLLLVDEGVQQLAVNVGGNGVFRQLVLAVGGQLDIAVAAAHDQDLLVRKLLAHLSYILAEGVGALVVGAHPVVDDGAAVAGEGGVAAIGNALDAVGLMEGTGHAVHVDIAAKQQRLEG